MNRYHSALSVVAMLCMCISLTAQPFPNAPHTVRQIISTSTTSPQKLENSGKATTTLTITPTPVDCFRTIKSVRAYVWFHAKGNLELYEQGKTSWTSTVRGRIYGIDASNTDYLLTPGDVVLTIDQSKPEGVFVLPPSAFLPQNHPYHASPTTVYTRIEFRIDASSGFTPSGVTAVDAELRLAMCVNDEMVYTFPSSPTLNERLHCWLAGMTPSATCSFPNDNRTTQVVTTSEIELQWSLPPACTNARYTLYEVELLRLYNTDETKALNEFTISAKVNWSAATRYQVKDVRTLKLSPHDGTGYYVWRVRPITTTYDGQANNPFNAGPWSDAPADGASITLATCDNDWSRTKPHVLPGDPYPHVACFFYRDSYGSKPWVQDVAIATDTSRTSIIADSRAYVDAFGRVTQQLVRDRTQDLILGSQAVFDRDGRTSLVSVPVPMTKTSLGYEPEALKTTSNALYTTESYDDVGTTYATPAQVSSTSPLGTYHSNDNSDLTVPGAGGYTFARTLYTSDGRPRVTIPPGDVYRAAPAGTDARSTRVMTSSVSMSELTSIFGNEAPNAENVVKIITISPDGVSTASYYDNESHLIATCVLGGSELDGNTSVIEGKTRINADGAGALLNLNGSMGTPATDQLEVVNTLNVNQTFRGGVRSHPDTVIGTTRFALAAATTVTVNATWNYGPNLKLGPPAIPSEACLDQCVECRKTIRLRVLRVDVVPPQVVNDVAVPKPDVVSPCTTATRTTPYVLTNLAAGEYVVERVVTTDGKDPLNGLTLDQQLVVDITPGTKISSALTSMFTTMFGLPTTTAAQQIASYKSYRSSHPTITGTLPATGPCVTITLPPVNECNQCSTLTGAPADATYPNFEAYVHTKWKEAFGGADFTDPNDFFFVLASDGTSKSNKYPTPGSPAQRRFDEMVKNMLSEPAPCAYDCMTLWSIWTALVDARIAALKQSLSRPQLPPGMTDIVEAFLDAAGRCLPATNAATLKNTIDDMTEAGIAYKRIRVRDTGRFPACSTAHTSPMGVTDWIAVNQCVNAVTTEDQERTLRETTKSQDFPSNSADATGWTNTKAAADKIMVEQCSTKCENMRTALEKHVRSLHVPAVGDGQIYCEVEAIIQNCMANCRMPLQTDLPGTRMEKIRQMKLRMTGTISVVLPSGGTCPSTPPNVYTNVGQTKTVIDLLVDYLNHDYDRRRRAAVAVECVNYAVVIYKFLTSLGVAVPACVQDEAVIGGIVQPEMGTPTDCAQGELTPPAAGYRFRLRVVPGVEGLFSRPSKDSCILCGLVFDGPRLSTVNPHPWVDILNNMMNGLWGAPLLGGRTPLADTRYLTNPTYQPAYEVSPKVPVQSSPGVWNIDGAIDAVSSTYLGQLYNQSAYINGTTISFNPFVYGLMTRFLPTQISFASFMAFDNLGYRIQDTTNPHHNVWRGFGFYGLMFTRPLGVGYGMNNGAPMGIWSVQQQRFFGWAIQPQVMGTELQGLSLSTIKGSHSFVAPTSWPSTPTAVEYTALTDSAFTAVIGRFEQDAAWRLSYRDMQTGDVTPIDVVKFYARHRRYLLGTLNQTCPVEALCSTVIGCNVCVKWDTVSSERAGNAERVGPVPCDTAELERLKIEISRLFQDGIQKLRAQILEQYATNCRALDGIVDEVSVSYAEKPYHYTLYYYDRRGRLVRTVSPKGVDIDPARTLSSVPSHSFVSRFSTDSRGRVKVMTVPDGGDERYYYDARGRLRFTADAIQWGATPQRMSYVTYDRLSRVTERGEVVLNASGPDSDIAGAAAAHAEDPSWPPVSFERRDVARFYYDAPASTISNAISGWTAVTAEHTDFVQKNVRGRMSFTVAVPLLAAGNDVTASSVDVVRSYFSYDATGALADHVSDIAVDNTTSSARLIKRTTPSYDPSTGNTMASMYQKGKSDVHYAWNTYRLDGTTDTVMTSRTSVLWDVDARYKYDKAGLMRREVLGADLVQGKDYVLTIAGQIKGIGHPSLDPQKDPGLDGATSGSNTHVAKDALGMAFGYYGGDFSRSYSGNQSPYNSTESTLLSPPSDLFSGFIGSYALKQQTMTVPPGQTLLKNGDLVGERFVYDRIGRIRSGTTQKRNGSSWEAETTSGYSGTYVYDQNGTMRRFTRRAMTDPVTSVLLDDVTISMNSTTSNVVDVVSEAATGIAGYTADVKNQTTGQTATDAKGQQTQNIGMNEARTTEWRSDGDVKRVTTSSTVLTHAYDAFGRIVRTRSSTDDKTWYRIHGTSMDEALYTRTGSNTPAIQEWTLYGIGRVGVDRTTGSASSGDIHYRIIGSKLYELNDHLGSVRGLVTDIKIPDGSGRFNAEEVEVRDYDPYGQERPNRAVTALTNLYGYAYHGMRKQIEGGWVNDYGTLFRPYEGGLGRWSRQDPVMRSWATPYEGMGSLPTMMTDPLGLEPTGGGGYADRAYSGETGGGGGTTSSSVTQTMATTGSSQAANARAPQMAPLPQMNLMEALGQYFRNLAPRIPDIPKVDNTEGSYSKAVLNGVVNAANTVPHLVNTEVDVLASVTGGTVVNDAAKKLDEVKEFGSKQWQYLTQVPIDQQFDNSWNFWTSPQGVETGTTIGIGVLLPVGASKMANAGRMGKAAGAIEAAETIANPIPSTMARVIAGEGPFPKLGLPDAVDVFVTDAAAIKGMNPAEISRALAIRPSDVFTIIEFPAPTHGLASPILRSNEGFVGGGLTEGLAPEFVIPNGPIPSGARVRVVRSGKQGKKR